MTYLPTGDLALARVVAEECYLRAERVRKSGADLPTGEIGRAMALRHERQVEWPRQRGRWIATRRRRREEARRVA